jgi:hypothetical protein
MDNSQSSSQKTAIFHSQNIQIQMYQKNNKNSLCKSIDKYSNSSARSNRFLLEQSPFAFAVLIKDLPINLNISYFQAFFSI